MVKDKWITSFNMSFGVEDAVVPYGKVYKSITELEEIYSPLVNSPNKTQLKWVEDVKESLDWLFSEREFFIYIIGGESYSHGNYDEELEVLAILLHRFVDLMRVFNDCLSYGIPSEYTDVDVEQIQFLYETIMSYNRYFRHQWVKKLSTEKKENYESNDSDDSTSKPKKKGSKKKRESIAFPIENFVTGSETVKQLT